MSKIHGLTFSAISVGDSFRVRTDSGCGDILFEKVTSRSAIIIATNRRVRISGYRRIARALPEPPSNY